MFTLTGYQIKDELHRGEKSVVYRANKDGKPVILKYLNSEYPSNFELKNFKKEYEILTKFNLKNSVQADRIETYKNSLVLVFEDIGASSIAMILKEKKHFQTEEFLEVAIAIAKGLRELGENQIIHKDIKPHNIIYNSLTKVVKIIDFGSTSLLSRENPEINMKNNLEGTLAYISPEQTGRMNCNVDYRTDFYSLGISYYQMIVGELPFNTLDPSEIVHSHIALNPVPPVEKRKDIPLIISNIILKLMKKSPEDRYQSMDGLIYDLEWCKANPGVNGSNASLQIGTKDFSSRFKIPEKLYGRGREKEAIFTIFHNACAGNLELALVNGYSGIGKTALINEMQKPIVEQKGYFIKGKYDKFKRSIPYRALIYSFKDLMEQILAESEIRVSHWKKEILDSLGNNAKIITDVIPELETLIGEQPPVVELPPTESQNRFNLVFQEFVAVFCKEEHPLVLFLDDLQWADLPSLQLLKSMLTGNSRYIFFVFSYRSNEVNATHPFATLLEDLKKAGREGIPINLEPLKVEDVNLLVAETLRLEIDSCADLATVLHSKTNGNPFFINELFISFYKEGLIQFKSGKWSYEIERIRKTSVSENVIDLMISKINKLSKDKIDLLKLAACVGNWFWINVFVGIKKDSESETRSSIDYLANEGYFLVGGNEVKFTHDKVLESVYSLLTEEEKANNHYLIGKRYLELADANEYNLDDVVFTIVNQLNQGLPHMIEKEKQRLIELNLMAGDKALASSAYETGLDCYRIAMQFLPKDYWETSYEKTLSIYTKRAKLESLTGHHEEADQYFSIILEKTKTILEKVLVYEMQIPLYVGQNKLREALDIGIKALALLGMEFPEVHDPGPEVMKAFQLQGERQIEELINLPNMVIAEKLAMMRILTVSVIPAYITLPSLFPLTVLKMVNLTLEDNSLAKESGFAFILYGIIMGSGIGNYDLGNKLGKLGIKIIEKLDAKNIKCTSFFFFPCMNNHWREHARLDLPYFLESIQAGMEYGDFLNAAYSTNHFNFQSLLMRKNLSEVNSNFSKFLPNFAKLGQNDPKKMFSLNYEMTLILQGQGKSLVEIKGDIFNENEIVPIWKEVKNATTLFNYYVNKLTLNYLFGSPIEAYGFAREADPLAGGCFGMMFVPEHNLFDSLSCLALLESTESSEADKTKYLEQITKNQEKMKVWAENCPANYGHKYYIVEALLAETKGDIVKVLEEFNKAIKLAKEHEYILEEAFANEFFAKFWMKTGNELYANVHLQEAHYAYKRWGCEPKVKQLEEKYPQLTKKQSHYNTIGQSVTISSSSSTTKTGSTTAGGNFLDLNTVVKASQTISGEIQLGKLLEKMMKILFENAGAERGFFILKDKGKWFIQAEGNANADTISVLQKKPVEGNPDLSPAIVNYVARTKGIILLNDAVKKGMFVNDTYVKEKQPKSVLCYPIINQGNLVGVIYLENNLTTDAFTPDRVEILKVLSSQIAVSVENSLLYANLEEKVEERTKDLNEALVEVRGLKEQQDGDYFLNTLLIEPLGQNNAFSKTVGIEFFIKQKKNFIFRRAEYELGGDINISENIELQGKKYIVFLNGDAMGKSIQGAGGVLVLGTVFKSILQRTISTSAGKNVYPERWLKNAFIEMHKAFESFDGSMLMSTAFGLIDEETGTMYFMAAEHPDIVLYRDGLASFIENPNQYRKLGTQGQTGSICVEVFSLRPDDIIILGSDGRDDIILGKEPEADGGYDIINQDEKLFLHHVKNADGDLEKIYEEIIKTGKLMDDLSLFKIHFKGVTVDENKLDDDLKLLENYKESGKYEKYAEVGQRVISNYPHLTNFLLEMSHACKELGQYEKAIDFGERLRLRDAKNTANLLNLIESYKGVGRKERAKTILDAYLKTQPENEQFLKLKDELNM